MKLEVSADDKIQVVLLAVCHARYLMRSSFLKEIYHKKLFTSLLGPNVNLFLVEADKGFCIWIEKHIFDTLRSMLRVLSRELIPELYSQAIIMQLLL